MVSAYIGAVVTSRNGWNRGFLGRVSLSKSPPVSCKLLRVWYKNLKKGNDMNVLLVKIKNKIHWVFSRLARCTRQRYEADEGELSHSDLYEIKKVAAQLLPKGRVVKKRELL